MFEIHYEPLSTRLPEWGTIAVIPWDTETFGFAVAELHLGSVNAVAAQHTEFAHTLTEWAEEQRAEVIVCSTPAEERLAWTALPLAGFTLLDYTLVISLPNFQAMNYRPSRLPVRRATVDDQPEVERIAEQVFRFGRYHADPAIPVHLANLRYRRWLRRACEDTSGIGYIYVAGAPGTVRGFLYATVREGLVTVMIMAIDAPYQRGITGYKLLTSALQDLQLTGARRLVSKISAGNLGVFNLAVAVGCKFTDPQAVFYWHAPNAQHLVPRSQVLAGVRVPTPDGEQPRVL